MSMALREGSHMKKCPYCAESIQDDAIVCKYCGRELDPERVAQVSASSSVSAGPYLSPKQIAALESIEHGQYEEVERQNAEEPGKRGSGWGTAVLIGFFVALLAVLPRYLNVHEAYRLASLDPGAIPYARGKFNDLVFHFIGNWILWSLLIALFLTIWRRSKAGALLTISLLIGASAALVYWPEIVDARSSRIAAESNPTDLAVVEPSIAAIVTPPTATVTPTSTPVPEPTPTVGPIVVSDDFSENSGIWPDCEVCRWSEGGVIVGSAQDYVTGDAIFTLCGPCGMVSNYRMGVDASFYDGMAGGGYGLVVSGVEDSHVVFRISTFQIAGLDQIEKGIVTVLVGQYSALIRPGRSVNHIEVIVTDAQQSGRSDIRLNINDKTLTVYTGLGISPSRVGLAVASEQGVLFDNFEFEELESPTS